MHRPVPMTCSEWADENYYLSAESAYIEGRWQTADVQVAILNSMGNDEIVIVNLCKPARIGYTQMLKAAFGYQIEHKKRNGMILQPTDGAASGFMKTHIETAIRDIPVLKGLAPWLGKKHRDNTLEAKKFTNQRQLWCLGGTSAKNYREKSLDFIIYDELAAFPEDVEKEGSPTYLGDMRLEGSAFPKSIRGSTLKIKGQCQMERAAGESETDFHPYVPCPHCFEYQTLKWGGKDAAFGLKWDPGSIRDVWYLCEKNGCVIRQNELLPHFKDLEWRCHKTNIATKDGIEFFSDGLITETPESVTWNLWMAYSPFTTWQKIVSKFTKAKDDMGKLKTFVNTVLGETWDDDTGEKLEWESLYARRENYLPTIPERAVYLAGSVDVQDDRLEAKIKAYGPGEESWLIGFKRLIGDPSGEILWQKLTEYFDQGFQHESGSSMAVGIICIDSGGHYTDEVYAWCRKDPMRRIPIRGASVYGKPVANFPRKRTRKGVYLTEIGTDNAKDIIYARLAIQASDLSKPIKGYMHLPMVEWADELYFKGLTSERKKLSFVKGRRVYRYECPSGVRNEPLDLEVYNLAAVRIAQQHFGLDLDRARPEAKKAPTTKKRKTVHKSSWL